MGSTAEEEEALSDFEDEAAPVVLLASTPSPPVPAESLKTLLAELESERQARRAAEAAKAESQSALVRLKTSSQEAYRQRDEAVRQREEILRSKEELSRQLKETVQRKEEITRQRDEIIKQRDDAVRERDDIFRQRDEAIKARDASRTEIEAAARLLVEGRDKITVKANKVKSFPGGLPRSSSCTGLAAIAFGFSSRVEDIVDELVRQHEAAVKNRNEMQVQTEQRNYQIAIEVSQLEASIQQLKDELAHKSSELDKWQKAMVAKDSRIAEIEQEMLEKLGATSKEMETLKKTAQSAENKVYLLELKIERIKPLLSALLQFILQANEDLQGISSSFSFQTQDRPITKSMFLSEADDSEERLQECLTWAKTLADLSLKIGLTWKEHQELRTKEREDMEITVSRLVREKKEITSFLRRALADRQEALDTVSKSQADGHDSILFQPDMESRSLATKKEKVNDDTPIMGITEGLDELKAEEAISMVSALEKGVKQEIFELQQTLATARAEINWLRATFDSQGKELAEKVIRLQELEQKEVAATEKVEAVSAELAAAEQEIGRWKEAATEEAAAGGAVLEELESCQEQISSLKKHISQLNQLLEEANNKLRSKEEMAAAAIVARKAAEQSLRIADERAAELRERIEEMNRQLEEVDGRVELGGHMGLAELCWPWHWFRGRSNNLNQSEPGGRAGAEMEELVEPLI